MSRLLQGLSLVLGLTIVGSGAMPAQAHAQAEGPEECGVCDGCWDPELLIFGHNAVQAVGGMASRGEGWHWTGDEVGGCLPGDCSTHHPPSMDCVDGPDGTALYTQDLIRVWALVNTGAIPVDELLPKFPGNVELNLARMAIQIVGCDMRVVAHIPLRPAITQALALRLTGI
jgi:hypothetical protein